MMKNKLSFVFVLIVSLAMLVSCSGTSDNSQEGTDNGSENTEEAFDPSNVKTMADVLAVDSPDFMQSSYSESGCIYAFAYDGTYYRAIADMPKDIADQINAISWEDEDRDAKINELLGPLEVKTIENLSEGMPSDDDLKKYIGKTGRELFADDWTYWYYNLEDMSAGLYHGLYSYIVTFEYDGEQMDNTDDFDFYEEFKDLKVKSITCDGIGDATADIEG